MIFMLIPEKIFFYNSSFCLLWLQKQQIKKVMEQLVEEKGQLQVSLKLEL